MCKNHAEILASVLSLSQRQTLRIVNNLTGHTINDLILKQRMNVGIAAIKNTDFTLKQISEMVGYETYSGFYIAFNKFFVYYLSYVEFYCISRLHKNLYFGQNEQLCGSYVLRRMILPHAFLGIP